LAWGYTPLPSRIPPYILSECQVRGDNPLNNDFKNFGKKCSLFPLLLCSLIVVLRAWE